MSLVRRPGLVVSPAENGSSIVHDPISGQSDLLGPAESFVLRLLEVRRSAAEIRSNLLRAFPAERYTQDEVGQLLAAMTASGLVQRCGFGRPLRSVGNSLAVIRLPLKLLRFHIPVFNPTRLLRPILPLVRPVTGAVGAVLLVIFLSVTCLVAAGEFTEIRMQLRAAPDVMTPALAVIVLLLVLLVKVLHELAHATVCMVEGAECRECGLLFLLAAPLFYTDVSSAWSLSRKSRLKITAAGIVTEVLIACVCFWLWRLTAPGSLRLILLTMVMVCSVNTVLFNGNPLLKFDGYFLLSDAVGVPNLSHRASLAVRLAADRLLAGSASADSQDPDSADFRIGLFLYGIAASVYRVFLTLFLVVFLQNLGATYRVSGPARITAGLFVLLLVAAPLVQWVSRVSMWSRSRRRLSQLRSALIVLLLVALSLIPLPRSVVLPAVVTPAGAGLSVRESAVLLNAAPYGTFVRSGDTVAQFRNLRSIRNVEELRQQQRLLQVRLESARRRSGTDSGAAVRVFEESLRSNQLRLADAEERLAALTLTASADGQLVPPLHDPSQGSDRDLPYGSFPPLAACNSGAEWDSGTLTGYICVGGARSISAYAAEHVATEIARDAAWTFLSDCSGIPEYSGVGAVVSERATETVSLMLKSTAVVPQSDGSWFGGPLPLFEVTLDADVSAGPPVPVHSTGAVRVQLSPQSAAERLLRLLFRTF